VYYVYGFMLLVSIILIIVTTCVTIVGTYFLLNAENYHWQWTAFLSGASTAGTRSLSLCHMPLRRLVATGVRSRNTR
jgi:transmembrane 9 superfamily protein 3